MDVQNLTEIANYQSSAVVSREIMKKSSGTVTLFAFDQGQGLSEHTAPFDALVCVLEGEAEVTVSSQPHTVSAGQMVIMPANKPHVLQAKKRFKMLLTLLKGSN